MPPCTRPSLSDAVISPNLHPLGPLGHREAIAELALAHHGQSWPVRCRTSPSCCHGHRQACSGAPLNQSRVPFDVRCREVHVGGDLTTGDLAVGEFTTG